MLLLWLNNSGLLAAGWHTWVYLAVGVVISLGSVWAARKLWLSYDTSMLDWRLARRKRRSSVLDF